MPELIEAADADVVVVMPGVGDLGEARDRPGLAPPRRPGLRRLAAGAAPRPGRHPAGPRRQGGVGHQLARAARPRRDAGDDWTDVAANDPARVDRLNAIIREVVGDREGGIVDLDAWAHRLPQGGEFGATHRLDGRDLTPAGAAALVGKLVPALTGEPGQATPGPDDHHDGRARSTRRPRWIPPHPPTWRGRAC